MDMQLYNYFRSSPSFRVRIALHFKELEFDYKPINLLRGEQRSPEYRKINPAGEVPALVHEGQVIAQSVSIIEFLEELDPKPALYPREPGPKARVRQFCEAINCTHPLHNLQVTNYLEKNHHFTEAEKTQWISHWMNQTFANLEQSAGHTAGNFCFGDHVTAADLFLIPQIFASKRFNLDLSAYPRLNRIYEHCMSLPAFIKAHPHKQIDTPDELKGKL